MQESARRRAGFLRAEGRLAARLEWLRPVPADVVLAGEVAGVVTGLVIDDCGFEILADDKRVGPRRVISGADAVLLAGLAGRYARAVQARAGDAVFLSVGRELYEWLDGGEGQLGGLLEAAARPVILEVRGPRSLSEAGWAVLRAPWELLAPPGGGFLAADGLTRFCVARRLGPPGVRPGLGGFQLGLAFMASSPRDPRVPGLDARELDFEAEESAILAAVGGSRADLLVEDTGDPAQLASRLADVGGMPVVHLSCHGQITPPLRPGEPGIPVLLTEDDTGGIQLTTAEDLAGMLTGSLRLLFVSACLTATSADAGSHLPPGNGHKGGDAVAAGRGLAAHSLAAALVSAGVPAVLGWDGSVSDRAATVFAGRLYRLLADHAGMETAAGDARRALLISDDPQVRADWHLARLWLGPAGGGPVAGGAAKRSLVPATRGTKVFLDRKRQVPVATAEMFVGRRPELQQALRALRSRDRAGVLVHGQGRLGKSSLAARIADRLPGHAVAVVFGGYGPMAVLDAISDAVAAIPAARDLIDARLGEVRDRPEAIGQVLTDLLAGPCAQVGDGGRQPLLLIIDDLEQVLEPNPAGPHAVAAGAAGTLAGVLRAFDPARTDSRVLVTGRFTFALGGLEERLELVQLRPLSEVAQSKLQRRQQALAPPGLLAGREALAGRAVAVSRGNPGLQDLTVMRLVYGQDSDPARAEATVAEMEGYLRQGDLPGDAEVRAFLENLALDTLLDQAGTAGRELLRAVTLFDIPVPETVIGVLAQAVGGSPGRLRGLGLLDPYPDAWDPARTALAASPLAAGRAAPLTPGEQAAVAEVVIGPLLAAWGGPDPRPGRGLVLEVQLARLALLADDPDVTAACAAGAVAGLRSGPAAEALGVGLEAIGLLDRCGRPVPLFLLRLAAEAAFTSGDGPVGEELLDRAALLAGTACPGGPDPLDRARVMTEQANRLITRGDLDQAGQMLHQARDLFTATGSELEAATAMGSVANIAYQRGDYDEALRIRTEVQLPAYERLGAARETAITWGRIADIAYRRGDYDEALRIRREVQLPAYERLGAARETAITWGNIADIAYMRGDYDEALRIRREVELPAYERLGAARETAITWGNIADIAYMRGDYDEALRIRREVQLPAYERLGAARETAITWGNIADIAYMRGDYDEALRIRREVELPAYERLGDTRETAITWGNIAGIAYDRGDYDEALRIRTEVQLPAYERLGDTRSIAAAWGQIARIARQRGSLDEAAELQLKRLEVNRQLGDPDGIAAACWDLARIDLDRENYQAAYDRLTESYQLFSRLQRPDGIALVGATLGWLLIASGHSDQARPVLTVSLAAAVKTGNDELVGQTSLLLNCADSTSEDT